jgi:hypothetical protein
MNVGRAKNRKLVKKSLRKQEKERTERIKDRKKKIGNCHNDGKIS